MSDNVEFMSNMESKFAEILSNYELNQEIDPITIVSNFKAVSAAKALDSFKNLEDNPDDKKLNDEFEEWNLETKLWHLVEILYGFRFSEKPNILKEYSFSSLPIKQENLLRKDSYMRELSLIISWIQINSKDVDVHEPSKSKWSNTKMETTNKALKTLSGQSNNLIDYLDIDAPLRDGKEIDPEDEAADNDVFRLIYQLILSDKIQEATDFANRTGNYSLALILIGATQDHINTSIDTEGSYIFEHSDNLQLINSGLKHKLLWKNTVFKLSQQSKLPKFERLIYNYLSGGDVTSNLIESSENWEESLLIYVHQLYVFKIEEFIKSIIPSNKFQEESLEVVRPFPQHSSIAGILNALSKSEKEVSKESTHPYRIISGSVMLNEVGSLLQNLMSTSKIELLKSPSLLRIVTHLAIFHSLVEKIDQQTMTNIITLYLSKLSDFNLTELIPVYLLFIQREADARETYSLFLSTITDEEERNKQLSIAKRFSNIPFPTEKDSDYSNDERVANVLRRTVERVMKETESHYQSTSFVSVVDGNSVTDDIDVKLYRSVDWFYENSMWEDAISATLVVVRRFLLSGKISSLRQFAAGKDFKKLARDYDLNIQTKSLADFKQLGSVSEKHKVELLEYNNFVDVIVLIGDWKKFLKDTEEKSFSAIWKSNDVSQSIEKVTKSIYEFIHKWLKELRTESFETTVYQELRSLYVPYLLMELLIIYKVSRFNNWDYVTKGFELINDVANNEANDFLECFLRSGKLDEFLQLIGEYSLGVSEKGIRSICLKSSGF